MTDRASWRPTGTRSTDDGLRTTDATYPMQTSIATSSVQHSEAVRGTGRARCYAPFRKAAVLGAGTMGAQIAAHLANAGLQVHLLDIPPRQEGGARNAVAERGLRQAARLKPDPFFTKDVFHRIETGNLEDHLDRIADVDWVIEAVVEDLDIKRALLARVEAVVRGDAIVSTNTSGLPVHEIAEGRSPGFRSRFLGTHFFNPPRYLKLLELVPSADTDPDVLARVAQFGRLHLGKGIVVARDTPYFIGNRIGVYAMSVAMRPFAEGDYTIEEIDTLTGTLVGRPKSATFRTADVVGLDVMQHVAKNLYEAVPEDESREAFVLPDAFTRLVEQGALGQKTGAGFYRKEGREIRSIDPATGKYAPARPIELDDLAEIEKEPDLKARLRALFEHEGRAGAFFRETTLDVLGYSARRIPAITENPADLDRALRWGFGWEMGPFEQWDAIGFEAVLKAMEERGIALPEWLPTMREQADSFYREADGRREVYVPSEARYVPDPLPSDEVGLAAIRSQPGATIWRNDEAALLDLGDGVALFEFRSKANTLGRRVIEGLIEAIRRVEDDPDLRGMVVGNEGKNFSVGANLAEAAGALTEGRFDVLETFVARFQEAVQRVRYARKPVVVAAHQRVLGGGCEMLMACPNPVAAAESYVGLVELGVGLIPAGTGTTHLAALAAERAPNRHPSEIQAWVQRFFENVAMAKVATSAREAQQMGYLAEGARVVMNEVRRLYVAREEVVRLSNEGYLPPPVRTRVTVLGRPTRAAIEVMLQQYHEGGFISEYDLHLGRQLAYVFTGGDLTAPQDVHEDYLLELEREVFLRLLGEPKTQARIESILKTNRPLRN